MAISISAADANRHFSNLLRRVRDGRTFVVTSHGRPVAKLVPVEERDQVVASARAALLERLRNAPAVEIGGWSRDELYERDR